MRWLRTLRLASIVVGVLGLVLVGVTIYFGMDWADAHASGRPWYWWGTYVGFPMLLIAPIAWLACDQLIIRRGDFRNAAAAPDGPLVGCSVR